MFIIAGPCVLQDLDSSLRIAAALKQLSLEHGFRAVFKASFDKANRTSLRSERGPGLQRGLEMLQKVGDETGLPLTTDIHLPEQAGLAAEVCQFLQIPAFLARQTDLLLAAAGTGRSVNVKKGQFMAPEDMQHVVDKLNAGGCDNVYLTERGTFFGYGRLVNDMTSLVTMRRYAPVIFDATHSVQRPGGGDGITVGNRELVEPLARAAVAMGVDGLFFETHPHPASSPSDSANMVALEEFGPMIGRLMRLHATVKEAWPAPSSQTVDQW